MSAPAMIKPTLIGTVPTSRGQAGVTARRGGDVSVAIGPVGASIDPHWAVHLAQLLLDAARVALGEGNAS